MTKVLVTGATGLLGCTLVPLLQARGHNVVRHGFTGAADVNADLRNVADSAAMLDDCRPDAIINLAALTNVDTCQTNPHSAYLLNVHTVENLCNWIRQQPSKHHLIQISTDQIYDDTGQGGGPYSESQVKIQNVYAFSKIAAEIAAAGVSSTVLRTNFFGRSRCPGRSSFSDWLYQSLKSETPVKVFDDVMFNPLSIDTLSGLIEQTLVQQPQGVFNLGAHGGLSKADFAYAFAAALDLPSGAMQRTQSSASQTLTAYRPKDMRMACHLFEQRMALRLPQLIDEIHLIRSDYLEPC